MIPNFNLSDKYFYWCFAFLLALVIAILFSLQGGFQDSLVYYEQFFMVKRLGFCETIRLILAQTGKLEPGIILVFYIQSFFINSLDSFLIINNLMINLLLTSLYFIYNKSSHDNSRISCLSIAILLLSYYTFANYIYIWRSIYSFYFIGLYFLLYKKYKYSFIFLIFAFFFHFSSIVYIMVFYIIKKLKLNKSRVIILSFIMSVFVLITIFFLPELITSLASGDGQSIFIKFDKEAYLIIRRILISSFLVFILLIYTPPKNFEKIYFLILIFVILSVVFSFNAQLSWRILAPAAILGTILLINTSKNKSIIYFLLLLSTIPSLRLLYLFSMGQFHAS